VLHADVSVVGRAILPLSLAFVVTVMWAGGRWIDDNTRYGLQNTPRRSALNQWPKFNGNSTTHSHRC
jgi:hypothetical protein